MIEWVLSAHCSVPKSVENEASGVKISTLIIAPRLHSPDSTSPGEIFRMCKRPVPSKSSHADTI